jgi:hypothetical protein
VRFLKKSLLALAVVAIGGASFAFIPGVRTTAPGRAARFCLGEAAATQWVNDTADRISSAERSKELQELADQLISEFAPLASTLPQEPFTRGRLLPIDRLPPTFRSLGGSFGDPEMVVKFDDAAKPTALILSWGHMRQCIVIHTAPITNPPQGFATRRVNDRIYVIANES